MFIKVKGNRMMAKFSPFVRKVSALLVVALFAVSNILAQVEPPSLPQLGLVGYGIQLLL